MNKHSIIALVFIVACQRPSTPEPLELPHEPANVLEQGLGYAQGPFWHDPQELSRVRLAARHILVSHDQVQGGPTLLGASMLPVARSREDALRRAVALARRAARDPKSFPALARTYSDDRSSAQAEGGLGTFSPASVPRTMVDALATLAEGAVSHVFESELGFHVVQRVAVAARQRVSFARVVVSYGANDGTANQDNVRTREQALQRAAQLSVDLRAAPQRFADVARTKSDADDGARGGDQGSFDLYELGAPALLLHLVSTLAVGQVSEPVDTPSGFAVLQRTAERPRVRYGFTELTLPHVSARIKLHGTTASEADARQHGERLLAALASGTRFDVVQSEQCKPPGCLPGVRTEWEGRGLPPVEQTLLSLAPGEVSRELISSNVGYHIVRRDEAPDQHPPGVTVRFDFPAPPTLEALIDRAHPSELAAATRKLGREAVAALHIVEPHTVALFDQLATHFEQAAPGTRINHLLETRLKLRALLGEQDAARIASYVRQGLGQASTPDTTVRLPSRAPL